MKNLIVRPSNSLDIKVQTVKTAYFAKKEIVSTEKTTEAISYTFKGNNNAGTKKRKRKIAKIIYKNLQGKLINKQQTSLEQVVAALSKSNYTKGDCIDIALVKEKIKFTKRTSAQLGEEVYIVIQTQYMPDREITLNLKQGGDTDALTTTKEPIYVTQNNKKVFAFKAVVGEFSQKSNALNAADFKDHAIAKITLQSTDQQENKQYKDALNKAEGKTSPFYIAMDAEPANQNWFEVKYEEVFDNRPNLWYYGEGNWFELKSKEVAEIGIYYNGKIDKVNLKDKAKVKYVYYDKDGKKHDLKDTYDIIEVDEYKNGKTTTSVPSGYTKKQIISNKRNKYTYNDKIVIEGTKEGKEAGKIRKYVKTGKKTPLIKISSKDYNNEGVNLKFSLKSDGTRPYIHPNAFACILGAIARVGYKDIVIVGFTSKDNHGFPSKTHVNGKHGDFRYLRKDKTGASLHIDTVEGAKKLDITRQEKLIDAFVKFGWPKFYSYKFELKKEQKEKQLLKKCDHLSGHHHHLHSRQFKVNFK